MIGPFPRKYGQIRSVHFTLPQSLPRSLSRGIKQLDLSFIHFRQFADLTHMVCELPDLEELRCGAITFDSFPIELPHRRPRINRNRLRTINIWDLSGTHLLPGLMLYLGVYNAMSFFTEGEIAVIFALLQVLHRLHNFVVHYKDDPHCQFRELGEVPVRSLVSMLGCAD